MKILPSIFLCCFLLSCTQTQEEQEHTPAKAVSEKDVDLNPATTVKKPSLLDSSVDEGGEIDHGAKYTFNPPEDDSKIVFGSYHSARPLSWEWFVPISISNTCNYRMEGTDTSDPALLTIKQFSLDDSEPIGKSIERWKALFRSDAGGPIFASMEELQVDGSDAAIVTLHGEYMGAGTGWRLKDHMLVVIILRNNTSTTFIKILGPKATVDQHASALGQFLENIVWVEPIESTE